MKRVLLLVVLTLLAVVLLARWLLADPGYLVIMRNQVEVEMTLGFAMLLGLAGFVATVAATLFLSALWDVASPFQLRGRWGRRLARRRFVAGFHALAAGKWKQAERLLVAAAVDSDWQVQALMGAALAADQAGDDHAVNAHLRAAGNVRRGSVPAGTLRAWRLLRGGYPVEALGILRALRDAHGSNPWLIQLMATALEQEHQWQDLVALLPQLKPLSASPAQFAAQERRVWHGLMKHVVEQPVDNPPAQQLEALRREWKRMPSHLQRDPALRAQYAGYLAQLGDGEAALSLVRKDIERHWDDRLPAILEAIHNVAPERLLAMLEQWLAQRPDNAVLLLTSGRVCLRAQLWGKARGFFAAAGEHGSTVAWAELARLEQALGHPEAAAEAMDRRLALLSASLPDLPLPGRTVQRGA